MTERLQELAATPLVWLAATLAAYTASEWLSVKAARRPLVNPVLLATAALVVLLLATRTPYATYAAGTALLTFLLGPTTVALAVPLWRNLPRVRGSLVPLLAALAAGSVTAIVTAVGIAYAFGAPGDVLASIAPKSATSPVAMAIAAETGGIPQLAATFVLITGIFGAVIVSPLFNALGVTDYAARGFAVGVAAHGVGTARAFQVNELAGTFAGIGMALNAALTAILLGVADAIWG